MSAKHDVSFGTINNWGRQGLLRKYLYDNVRRCLYEPLDDSVIIKGHGGRRTKSQSSLLHRRNEVQYET